MSKLTKASEGQPCALQLFPYCEHDTTKTSPCHLNSEDKGIGNKSPDWWLVDGCNACHAIIDGHMKSDIPPLELQQCVMRALFRTWKNRIERGLIEIK